MPSCCHAHMGSRFKSTWAWKISPANASYNREGRFKKYRWGGVLAICNAGASFHAHNGRDKRNDIKVNAQHYK